MLSTNGIILMWILGPFMEKAMNLLKSWGLYYINMMLVWRKVDKEGKPYQGLGRITQHNYEYLALAAKGSIDTYL